MVFKTKKKKKSVRMHGSTTYGWGARKKHKGSGHRGGFGMAGTGKRADHKKSLILVKYGNKYFGKQGVTSRGTKRNKLKAINLREIQQNFDVLMKKYGKGTMLVLEKYKILGDGEITNKIEIKAKAVTKSAKEKIEKAGGKVIVFEVKKREVKKVEEKEETPEKEDSVEENIEEKSE